MMPTLLYPLDTQIAEVKRELAMRARVYPRFVEGKKVTLEQAQERVAILTETLHVLIWLRDEQQARDMASEGRL